jgi:hypothetical protein
MFTYLNNMIAKMWLYPSLPHSFPYSLPWIWQGERQIDMRVFMYMLFIFQIWWFNKFDLSGTTWDFISCQLNNSKVDYLQLILKERRMEKCLFKFVFLEFFFFQHYNHKQVFNTFYTNIHPIYLWIRCSIQCIWIHLRIWILFYSSCM